jgi:hypothetical protein
MIDGWEEKFRAKFADVRVIAEARSENFINFTVVVGTQPVAESGVRELAFKYALDDLRDGLLNIKPQVAEQLRLKGI